MAGMPVLAGTSGTSNAKQTTKQAAVNFKRKTKKQKGFEFHTKRPGEPGDATAPGWGHGRSRCLRVRRARRGSCSRGSAGAGGRHRALRAAAAGIRRKVSPPPISRHAPVAGGLGRSPDPARTRAVSSRVHSGATTGRRARAAGATQCSPRASAVALRACGRLLRARIALTTRGSRSLGGARTLARYTRDQCLSATGAHRSTCCKALIWCRRDRTGQFYI